MAVDEAILQAVSAEEQPPTLRLYAWDPFCLSLGYGQHISDVDTDRLYAQGWQVVRRPTGGRAILHGDELTYSVSLPITHALAQGDVIASYRRLSEALIAALKRLGLLPQSEKQSKSNKGTRGPVCFEVPSHYEITSQGRKLVGSAQVRRKTGILQHGTMPLIGDVGRICDALFFENDQAREIAKNTVRERAITLSEALGSDVDWVNAADALAHGFRDAFDISFEVSTLSKSEYKCAEQLMQDVYANDGWTNKR